MTILKKTHWFILLSVHLCFLSTITHAGVELPRGIYHQSITDLQVQTQAGDIAIKRTWYDNQWYIKRAWTPLSFEYNYLDDSIKAIGRNDEIFERVGKSSTYRFDEKKTILKTDSGFRWQNTTGDWLDYNEQGVLLKYGHKHVTQATFKRNSEGQIAQVIDTRGRTIYTFHYQNKRLQKITDNSLPARSVLYHYEGEQLKQVTDVLQHDTVYTYTGSGDKLRMSSYTDSEQHKTTIHYNNTDHVSSILDKHNIGYHYRYDYDKVKKQHYTRVRHSSERTVETWYNAQGNIQRKAINGHTTLLIKRDSAPQRKAPGTVRSETRSNRRSLKTINDYDAQDNLLQQTLPDGSTLSYRYSPQYALITQQTDERGIITKNTYNTKGELATQTEARDTPQARTTTYAYNDYGQLTSINTAADADSEATLTEYQYDDHGNLKQVTDAEQRVTTYTHDNQGNIKTQTSADKTTRYTYNAAGWLIETTDPLKHKTQYDYDTPGNLTETRYYQKDGTLHSKETRTYTYRSELETHTDAAGDTTTYHYDQRGNLKEITDAGNKTQTYQYDLDNRRTHHIDAQNNQTQWIYGKGSTPDASLLLQINYPTYQQTLTYNNRGWLSTRINTISNNAVISHENSALTTSNNIQKQKDQYHYDRSGQLIKHTDAKTRTTRYEYDPLGRQIRITTPDTGITQYHYDNRDNILSVTDANTHVIRTYTYDRTNLNRTESKPEKAGQTDTHQYNAQGLLERSTDAEQQTSRYYYNDGEQLVRIERYAKGKNSDSGNNSSTADKTIRFDYNHIGLLSGYQDGITQATYEYDKNQRKTKETVTYGMDKLENERFSKSHEYTYDTRGNKDSFTDPQHVKIKYYYNDNNQLKALVIPTIGSINFSSYQWQVPREIMLPGGHKIHYEYDDLLRPKAIKAVDAGGHPLHTLNYEYDKVNNISRKGIYLGIKDLEHHFGLVEYGYNLLDRLEDVDYSDEINLHEVFGQADEHFSYDGVGNRLTDNVTTGNWTYNQNNELQRFDDTSYKYNLNGQMTEKTVNGTKTYYSYNLDGRLKEIKDNSNQVIAQYEYDPFGRRLFKTLPQNNNQVIYFHYNDEGLIAEYTDAGNLIQSYGYKPDSLFTTNPVFTQRPDFITKAKGGYVYYISDHLGTPQKLITETGRKVWEASADAFGKTNIINNEFRNPLRFPGQFNDEESSLRYNLNRFYDVQIGRYITSDPIDLDGGINTYIYALQNPLIYIDTEGQAAQGAALLASMAYIAARICAQNKKLCKELYKCIKNPRVCKKRFCKIMRSKTLYHPFCDVPGCSNGANGKGAQDSPASAQLKKAAAEACLALRQFVKNVCFNGKADEEHQKEIDLAKRKVKSCEPLCLF